VPRTVAWWGSRAMAGRRSWRRADLTTQEGFFNPPTWCREAGRGHPEQAREMSRDDSRLRCKPLSCTTELDLRMEPSK
jgi:hypothetical protein